MALTDFTLFSKKGDDGEDMFSQGVGRLSPSTDPENKRLSGRIRTIDQRLQAIDEELRPMNVRLEVLAFRMGNFVTDVEGLRKRFEGKPEPTPEEMAAIREEYGDLYLRRNVLETEQENLSIERNACWQRLLSIAVEPAPDSTPLPTIGKFI